jgi:molecular chaperone HtpG
LTDEKFAEKAKSFHLYKTTAGEYFNLDELKEKFQAVQTDKDGNFVVLYATDVHGQDAFIANAQNRGMGVVVLDSPLTAHLVSQLEYKESNVKFKRVDSDVLDKLVEKEENNHSVLTDEEKSVILPLFEEQVDNKNYTVKFENLDSKELPVTIVQNEFMRRMKEQSAMGGGGMNVFGELPDSYMIVLNANHPLMNKIQSGGEDAKEMAQNALQLAMLSKGILKGAELTKFIQNSFEHLTK